MDKQIEQTVERVYDTEHAVEIAPDVFWVGFFDEEEQLHCNPYLIRNGEESILIDPGSIPDFPTVARKVFEIVDPESVSTIVLQHQDPDLCACVPVFEDLKKEYDIDVYSMKGTSYLIHHYGIKGNLIRLEHGRQKMRTRGGRELIFDWTPYAHSFGAMITYDVQTKTLFTSDLLGGLGSDWNLYHDQGAFENMKKFMQLIIPSNRILRYALSRIQSFDAEVYAPQHGQIILREDLGTVIDFLKDLPCGIDLLENMPAESNLV